MAVLRVAEMHLLRIGTRQDSPFSSSIQGGSGGGGVGEGRQSSIGDSRDKFDVSNGLVVADVAKKLASILEEALEVGRTQTSPLAERLPITLAIGVENENQVKDRLRFR